MSHVCVCVCKLHFEVSTESQGVAKQFPEPCSQFPLAVTAHVTVAPEGFQEAEAVPLCVTLAHVQTRAATASASTHHKGLLSATSAESPAPAPPAAPHQGNH